MTVINPINAIDAYKLDHRRQYPEGTSYVYSNFTPRTSRVPHVNRVVSFGLQAFLKGYLQDAFQSWFDRDEDEVVQEYIDMTTAVLGPNDVGGEHIRALHQLGYIPLEFKALPEGSLVPLRVPFFTVENTHPDFFWLVNYIESVLSASVWLPSTSATNAWHLRDLLVNQAKRSGGSVDFVDWQGHDFSFRGMSNLDAAAASGAGHLLAFTGTDSLPALDWINHYYPGDNGFLGGSVAATEHSVMCAGGEWGERETFARLLKLYPSGIVSVVSDTWDLWAVITRLLPELKEEILARDGKLVIRPDSGDPVKILCGDSEATTANERAGVIQLLWDQFGGTVNAKGFRELDSHIGAIYGDSINYDRAQQITDRLQRNGFASTNVVFGVGSYTYQHVTRDTFGFAMKATWAEIDGKGRNLFKDPITDGGMKKSARGRLSVVHGLSGDPMLIDNATPEQEEISLLKPVWRDGGFIRQYSFAEVRKTLRDQQAEIDARQYTNPNSLFFTRL